MLETCLALALFAGQAVTFKANAAHTSDFNGRSVEVQTCSKGLGAHVYAVDSGFYAGGIQYGIEAQYKSVVFMAQPFFGGSYTPREVRELPLGAQFWCGLNVMVDYKGFTVGAKYGHASNGGLSDHNAGIDLFTAFIGVDSRLLQFTGL